MKPKKTQQYKWQRMIYKYKERKIKKIKKVCKEGDVTPVLNTDIIFC